MNERLNEILKQPLRQIGCQLTYKDDTDSFQTTFANTDALKGISIQRTPEADNKFFGFGVTQMATITLIDINRRIEIDKGNYFEVAFDIDGYGIYYPEFPVFWVEEINRDENTNDLIITAYDSLYKANRIIADISWLKPPYTLRELAEAIQPYLGRGYINYVNIPEQNNPFDKLYSPNFDGFETVREILTAIAEATQTIYYVSAEGILTFKKLDIEGQADFTIDKTMYMTLSNSGSVSLRHLVSSTELGDNHEATLYKKVKDSGLVITDAEQIIESKLVSKNIFNPEIGNFKGLVNVSAFGDVLWDEYLVKDILKPATIYTLSFNAIGLQMLEGITNIDGTIGLKLYDKHRDITVDLCAYERNIVNIDELVQLSATFTTPADLEFGNYELLIYTQLYEINGEVKPNKLDFNFIQLEEGSRKTPFAPVITDFSNYTFGNIVAQQDGTFTIDLSDNIVLMPDDDGVLVYVHYLAASERGGETQYIHNNPFYETNENLANILDEAFVNVYGLTYNKIVCDWRGNYSLNIGDKINFITKDDDIVTSYLVNDLIDYNGGLSQTTRYDYVQSNTDSLLNPTTLGEALKRTSAQVDKVNKQIDLLVVDDEITKNAIANLQINTNGINTSVSSINQELGNLANKLNATMSAEDIEIYIESALGQGVNSVKTATGFTFNEEGLTINKSGTEMITRITEDGMKVYRDYNEVLTANNVGVNAENLHATTFLRIGEHSRLEDYNNRSGCYWVR